MEKQSKPMNAIFYFGIGTLYVYALSSSLLRIMLPDMIQPGTLLITAFFAIALFYLVFLNRYTMIISLIIFLSIFLLAVVARYGVISQSGKESQGFIDTAYGAVMFIRGLVPYDESYRALISGSVILLFALFTAAGLYVIVQFYILSILGFAIFVFTGALNSMEVDFNFLIFLFCFFVLLMKKLNLIALGKKGINHQFTVGVIPVALAIVVLIGFVPAPERGGYHAEVQNFFRDRTFFGGVEDFIYESFHPKFFSFSMTGFSRWDSLLGGKITASDRNAMRVTADERTYLRGIAKNIYTGTSWSDNTEERVDTAAAQAGPDDEQNKIVLADWWYDLYKGTGITIISDQDGNDTVLQLPDSGVEPDFIQMRTLGIDVGKNRLMTIFQPPLPVDVSFSEDVTLHQKENGDLYVDKLLGKNARYTFTYASIDYHNEFIQNLLRMYSKRDMNGNWRSEYSAYDEETYTQYTDLPPGLPQRVYDLAYELAEPYDNDYDRLKALEEYLEVFPYTLAPDSVPPNRDFVDYFLFEGKEGYCTYYATALAVMARCIGIPTRYLEGYVMPAESEGSIYNITDLQAHSWVEAYFENMGWVPFEPTPPYNYMLHERTPSNAQAVFAPEMLYMDQYEAYMENFDFYDPSAVMDYAPAAPQADTGKANERQEWETPQKIVLVILLILIIRFWPIWERPLAKCLKWRFTRQLKRIRKLNNNDATIWYFRSILKVAKAYHYPIMSNETAMSYARRLGKRFALANETIFMSHLAKIFSDAAYGLTPVTDESCRLMESAYLEMLEILQKYRMKKAVYILRKYVLNQF